MHADNADKKSHGLSPLAFEQAYDRFESQLAEKLAKANFPGLKLIALSAIAVWVFVFFRADWNGAYPEWARTGLFQERTPLATALIGLSFFSALIPARMRSVFFFFSLSIAWIVSCYVMQKWAFGLLAFPVLSVFAWLALRLSRASPMPRRLLLACAFFSTFALVAYGLGLEAIKLNNTRILQFFWLVHPELFLAAILSWILFSESKTQRDAIAFIPTNALAGLLWPLELNLDPQDQKAKNRLWWRGYLNLALGEILLIGVFKLVRLYQHLSSHSFWVDSPLQYLEFLLAVIAGFNIAVGVTRMYGIPATDITRFPFLARTPLEIWKRGSSYVYDFILRFVFLPAYRWTRSLFLTSLICLLVVVMHLFLFHEILIRKFYQLALPVLSAPQVDPRAVLIFAFSYAFVWYVLIVVFDLLWRKGLARKTSLQWLSIVLTQATISYIYALSYGWLSPAITRWLLSH